MSSPLFDLTDALRLASDRDPVHARQLADAALAASTVTSTKEYHLLDLPIDWDGEVQNQTLGIYLSDEAPGDDHPDDEGVFFWVHARDVPALIAGKDISGDGWTLAKPDSEAMFSQRHADNMRNLLAEGEMKVSTFIDHLRRLQERFGGDAGVAYRHKHHCSATVSGIIERIREQQERLGSEAEWVAFDDWVDPLAVLAHASAAGYELTDAEAIEAVDYMVNAYVEHGKPDDTAAWIRDAINYVLGLD